MEHTSVISLRSLFQAVRRHWLAALLVFVALFGGAAFGILQMEKKYTATATVLLAPTADQLTPQSNTQQGTPMTDPFFVRSETDIASGDGMGREVIEQLKLSQSEEFRPRRGLRDLLGLPRGKNTSGLSDQEVLLDNVLQTYKDDLSVANDGRSNTLTVSFTAANPRLAAEIANAHAEAYLREQSMRHSGLRTKSVEWLRKEVEARAEDVRKADAAVQQFQLKNGIVSANDSTVVEQRLGQLNTQLMDARRQLSTQTALLAEVRRIRKGGDAGSAAGLLEDDTLTQLLQSRATSEANVATLDKRLVANHPALIKERQTLAGINKALDQHLTRMESESSSNASSWQKQVSDLEEAVKVETGHKVSQDRVAVSLPSLTSQAQVRRTVFETVLNRYQTLLAEQAFAAPTASIIEMAVPSSRASFPKVPLFMVIALMLSLVAATGSAVALESRRAGSIGLTAMADAVGVRPLVAIPRVHTAMGVSGVTEMRDPRLFVESIRFLRTAVLSGQAESRRKGTVCLITSVLPRQGKSLVAMSLARSLARSRRKTLFLEIDLRRPTGSSLARRSPPEYGVAAVLEQRASISDAVVKDANPRLDLMLAESGASSALDCLTQASLGELLDELRNIYDAIVIDSPPIGIVTDALTLVPLVDEVVVVAKDMESSVPELQRGIRLLRERGASAAGLVLTSVDPSEFASVNRKTLHNYVMGVPGDKVATARVVRAEVRSPVAV